MDSFDVFLISIITCGSVIRYYQSVFKAPYDTEFRKRAELCKWPRNY